MWFMQYLPMGKLPKIQYLKKFLSIDFFIRNSNIFLKKIEFLYENLKEINSMTITCNQV